MKKRILAFSKPAQRKRAVSLVEILVVVGVIGLAFTLVSQMVSSGTKNVGSSLWHSERLKESQLFFKMLREDLHKASDSMNIDYSVDSLDKVISISPKKFSYHCPSSENFINPFGTSNSATAQKVARSGEGEPEVNVAAFGINKIRKAGVSEGYQIGVKINLKENKIYYIRQLQAGAPTADDDETLIAPPGKMVFSDVDFIYVDHEDIKSQLTGAVNGALVNFYVKVKNKDDEHRVAEFKQTIKLSITAQKF